MKKINEFENVTHLQNQTMKVIDKRMVKNLHNNRSIGSGTLVNSITTSNVTNKNGTLKSILEIGAWYALLVDKGIDNRGSGKQPPIAPIQQWIKQKSISVPAGLTIKEFSFAIAKKVAKKGQRKRAYPFIQSAITEGQNYFIDGVGKVLIKDVAINTNIILDSSPYIKPIR